ncbi:MAG: DUF2236 domain-containing protein [Deltaproteobacteria bacterium]|nr:DUF2236 domain-containing protein [Deltaproteobacteria bacterium]
MPAAPTEFRYFERLNEPLPRRLRAVSKRFLGFDPAPPTEVAETFASMYFDADPLAEAFVDEVYLGRGRTEGRAMLEQVLAQGVDSIDDAPESLRTLFADIETDPEWVDWGAVERGAKVFRRWGTAIFRFAGAVTLAAYAESSVAKPLALTGAYAGGSTKHRFLETAAFWIAVSEPGGLRPGGEGRASALRVRIMHVFVRQRLKSHPEWKGDAWGVPISQADALLTLLGGSVVPGLGLHAMGYRTSRDEIRDAMHFWRYVGHLMGVRPRVHPDTIGEALQILFVAAFRGAMTAGEDGRHLCKSFVEAFTPGPDAKPWAKLEDRLHRGFTQFFLPPPVYRANRLPSAGPWALVPLAMAPPIFGLETLRRHIPPLEKLADTVARRQRRRWLERHLPGRKAAYAPVETLRGE